MKHNFKKLVIWQDAMDLCDHLYDFVDILPAREKYNLIQQLEKCAVSIPSNIAEGSGKRTAIHFSEFLSTSLSSCYEAETQVLICKRRKYAADDQINSLLSEMEILQKRIFNFRESILGGK